MVLKVLKVIPDLKEIPVIPVLQVLVVRLAIMEASIALQISPMRMDQLEQIL